MSAAAGAPPPPPPTSSLAKYPSRCSSFDDLPAELLLILYSYLGLEQFMNLALVIYPTLRRHSMVPELTTISFVRILSDIPALPTIESNSQSAVARMPVELWLQIAEYLEPANSIGLVIALGGRFWQLSDRPSDELVMCLRVWSRRARKNV